MNRGMFMDPQMRMMLQMRDQMRAQYAPQPTEMPQQVTDMQMPLPALDNAEPMDRLARLSNQMPQQQQTTEQTLEQLQGNIQQMQQQQQRLSEHLGAGSGMLRQLQQPQQGLGGLIRQLSSEPARMYAQGPESMRLQAFPVAQGNPFGG
jgi:chromosome segregation ATPase